MKCAFAQDLGDEGPPFVWDEERRAQWGRYAGAGMPLAQLDATYWGKQSLPFAAHGTYRTRDLILGYYDAYATDDPEALEAWLGPEEKRAERHPSRPAPFGRG